MKTTRWGGRRLLAAAAVTMLALVACGGNGDTGGTDDDGTGTATGTTTEDEGDDQASGSATMLHGITGEGEQAALQAMVDAYEEATGNTIEVEPSPDFETVIVTRVTGNNAPDLALYPQPGLLGSIVEQGGVLTLDEAGVDVSALEADLVPGMVDTGTFDDQVYGVVVKLGLKSLLWYAADDFESAGYEVPDTWEAMLDLTDQISSDLGGEAGRAPWCIGIESGGATGWVATDWIEDIMLRLHGADVYDQWVAGELPFDSPEVRAAFEELEKIWFDEDAVLGGTTGILQTPFGDAATPMFDDPPGCFLHRQAGFISGSFPEGAELGTDYGMAYFPNMENSPVDQPVLFAGDVAAIHSDNPVAADFLEFVVSQEGQQAWLGHEGAGSLSVRTDFDSGSYPSEELAQQGDILSQAGVARFDASDLMPSEVGAGAFWTETVAWLSGGQDLDTTLRRCSAADRKSVV